ncbi:Ger(x)C family spore germination protein [Bacillus cereus]|uniref:Ger(x)C family spore germination protein n=1 Tax=Bacillus cereus TaxID=1396 RepID=UPI001ABFCC0B|nr:Ger(x)C family spore germination protein [Bacillus cereus]
MKYALIYVGIFCLFLVGCRDYRNLEDISLEFVMGLEIDEKNQLIVYTSSPTFKKDTFVKEVSNKVYADTIRNSREKLDEQVIGMIDGSKTQIILLGENLIKKRNWIRYLDVFYRDARNSTTPRVIAVQGSLEKVFFHPSKQQPQLSLYLKKLLATSYQRNNTVSTHLQALRDQQLERGITPSITRMNVKQKPRINGTLLLDDFMKKRIELSTTETKLLRILQGKIHGELPFSCKLLSQNDQLSKDRVSFSIRGSNKHVHMKYAKNFIFDIPIHLEIAITEFSPSFTHTPAIQDIEKKIERAMNGQYQKLITKIQLAHIDPIGLGLYARAYAYPTWKKLNHPWGDELAQSKIRVHITIKIMNKGTIS